MELPSCPLRSQVAPALPAGCPVILKPASKTPLSAIHLAECFHAADVPAGVFQLVIGDAAMISAEFLANPICRKVSFYRIDTGRPNFDSRGRADDQAVMPGAWRRRACTDL
jgi:acyl-CoA reductase-like NAD-dependent aldehyde dehydrogenase